MNVKEIEQKFYSGDHISDDELLVAISHFENLVESLECLGDRWAHSRNEARRIFDAFESFKIARGKLDEEAFHPFDVDGKE